MQNRKGISDRLQAQTYTSAALIPASPWLEPDAPGAPNLRFDAAAQSIKIEPAAGKQAKLYAIWKRFDSGWLFFVQPATQDVIDIGSDTVSCHVGAVVVSAVDHAGNESPRTVMQFSAPHP